MNRLLTNLCSDDLPATRDFYVTLFDFDVSFESDWFINLVSKDKGLELSIIDRTHELVPPDYQKPPQGFYLTIVVEDVDQAHRAAQEASFRITSSPTDTFYGQRRMLLADPNGVLVDVSSPISDFNG